MLIISCKSHVLKSIITYLHFWYMRLLINTMWLLDSKSINYNFLQTFKLIQCPTKASICPKIKRYWKIIKNETVSIQMNTHCSDLIVDRAIRPTVWATKYRHALTTCYFCYFLRCTPWSVLSRPVGLFVVH